MDQHTARQPYPAIATVVNRMGCLLNILKTMIEADETLSPKQKPEMVALLDSVAIGSFQILNISAGLIDSSQLSAIITDIQEKVKEASEKRKPEDNFTEQKSMGTLSSGDCISNENVTDKLNELMQFGNIETHYNSIVFWLKPKHPHTNPVEYPLTFLTGSDGLKLDPKWARGYYANGKQFLLPLPSFVLIYDSTKDLSVSSMSKSALPRVYHVNNKDGSGMITVEAEQQLYRELTEYLSGPVNK